MAGNSRPTAFAVEDFAETFACYFMEKTFGNWYDDLRGWRDSNTGDTTWPGPISGSDLTDLLDSVTEKMDYLDAMFRDITSWQ